MKALHSLTYLCCLTLLLTLQNCKKNDPVAVPQLNFTTTDQVITEGQPALTVQLSSSISVPATTNVLLEVTLVNAPVYGTGNDFITTPAVVNNTITVTGSNLAFTIQAFLDTKIQPGQSIKITIASGNGYTVGTKNSVVISFNDCTLGSGLVAEYLFNGGADDTSTKNHPGTIGTGATLTTDKAGAANSAFSFDGSANGSITIPDNADVNFSQAQDFSISVWASPASVQNDLNGTINDIIRKWQGDYQGYAFGVSYYNSTFTTPNIFTGARYDGSSCADIPEARSGVVTSTFHHILFTKSGTNLNLYVDNILVKTTQDFTVCETTNTSPLVIGRRGSSSPRAFTGKIDDVRIYNRALTTAEIGQLFSM